MRASFWMFYGLPTILIAIAFLWLDATPAVVQMLLFGAAA